MDDDSVAVAVRVGECSLDTVMVSVREASSVDMVGEADKAGVGV